MTASKHRHSKWLLPLVIIGLCIGVILLLKANKPAPKAKAITEKEWSVATVSATFAQYRPEITLYGQVESRQSSQLTAAVQADVAQLLVREGDAVTAGQLLVSLDDRDAQLAVAQRTAELASAKAQVANEKLSHQSNLTALKIEQEQLEISRKSWERYQTLAKKRLASDERVETAQSTYNQQRLSIDQRKQLIAAHPHRLAQAQAAENQAQAALRSAQLNLSRTQITAPFDGLVTQVDTAVGNRVNVGGALLSLYDQTQLEIRAQVPKQIVTSLQQALSTPESSQPDALLAGSNLDTNSPLPLARLAAAAQASQGGRDAFFSLPEQTSLSPGQTVALTLRMPTESELVALPPQALYGSNRIYTVVEGRLNAVTVELRGYIQAEQGERLLVSSNELAEGDAIVVTQLPNAINGLKVKDSQP